MLKGQRRLVGALLLTWVGTAVSKQILYQPGASSTFVAHKELPFTVQYADANAIEAITCVDYVQLGDYKARVPFACFLKATTPVLKDIDGVAGFGIPKLGAHGEALPMPLLWALTDPSNVERNSQALERRFTFFSSKHSAELQLGGYDPESIDKSTRHAIKSLSPGEFIVPVTSLRVGLTPESAVETLQWKDQVADDKRGENGQEMEAKKQHGFIPGVLDTGTSCLVIPSNDRGGMLVDQPFKKFVHHFVEQQKAANAGSPWSAKRSKMINKDKSFDQGEVQQGSNVYLTIDGKDYTLPYHTLLIEGTDKPCVRGSPPLQQSSIILGDVFFHTYAAEFDMRLSTRQNPATITLAKVSPKYVIIPESTPIIPVEQAGQPLVRMHVHKDVDKLPIDNERGTKYFVQVTIGTPPQLFKLAFDTGSSTLGVFVAQPTMNNVLLEEIGGAPLPVRPIPYLASTEEQEEGGDKDSFYQRRGESGGDGVDEEVTEGTQRLLQTESEARGGQAGGGDSWRGAWKAVAAGGLVCIFGILHFAGQRRRRGVEEALLPAGSRF